MVILVKEELILVIQRGSFNFFLNGTSKVHFLKSQIKMIHGVKKNCEDQKTSERRLSFTGTGTGGKCSHKIHILYVLCKAYFNCHVSCNFLACWFLSERQTGKLVETMEKCIGQGVGVQTIPLDNQTPKN